ncbi:MAG: restriction endonuclease subunit S [Oceanococcus sp.]|nr:MAG: restriction endonuclease subunit S [Oceanococcus sp.]
MALAVCRYTDTRPGVGHWIPSLPSHWRVKPVKRVFAEVNERSQDGSEDLLSVSEYFGVKPRREAFSDDEHLSRAESLVGYKKCRPGDLVMNIMLAWKTGLGVSGFSGIVSPAYSVFRLRESGIPRYFHYLLRSPEYVRYFKAYSSGVIDSRLRLYPDVFGSLGLVVPSEEEQQSIARFLDYETARIDELIAKQERLIELLKEKRQAVISHAVTKGLNTDAPMKDSGVEWLGEVPAHWGITRLKFGAGRVVDCLHSTPEYEDDGEFPAIRTADIGLGILDLAAARRVSKTTYAERSSRMELRGGDIIYSREGERFGMAALMPYDKHACLGQRVMAFRAATELTSEFLMWSLNSTQVYRQAQQDVIGSTSPHVNVETIKNFWMARPPVEEQRDICRALAAKLSKMRRLEGQAASARELLQERRSALISAAVTGKIDVRDWQPPENNKAA